MQMTKYVLITESREELQMAAYRLKISSRNII
jgi:hypothetical protein